MKYTKEMSAKLYLLERNPKDEYSHPLQKLPETVCIPVTLEACVKEAILADEKNYNFQIMVGGQFLTYGEIFELHRTLH